MSQMFPPTPPFNQRAHAVNQLRKYALAFSSGAPQVQPGGGFSTLAQGQGGYGSDINQQVMGILGPQLQAAADSINRRSSMASQIITSLTNSYQGLVGETASQMPRFYKPEIKQARNVAGYARDALTSAGTSSAAGLSADLAQAGVSGPGDINLSQMGAGAGGAAYGTGIAELDALIARKAAQSAESALEPSFAAGMGTQQQGIVAAQLARQLADLQENIAAQAPGLVSDLTERGYQHQQDLLRAQADQRDYEERVRQFNLSRQDTLSANRLTERQRQAGIVSPNAPTVAGRQAYWQSIADRRTQEEGIVYRATSTGIRPVDVDPKKPGIQPKMTLKGGAYAQAGVKIAQGQQKIDETARRNKDAHEEAMGRLRVAQRNAATNEERARIAKQVAEETRRYHDQQIVQQIKKNHPKVDLQQSIARGVWVDATGTPIPSLKGKKPPKYLPRTKPSGKGATSGAGNPLGTPP